jgi:HPt (histidine-containing phosphotransfer) domain-containing protein
MTSKTGMRLEKALSANGIAYEIIHLARPGSLAQQDMAEQYSSEDRLEAEIGEQQTKGGSIDPVALARANSVLAALSESYPEMVHPEVEHLLASWTEIRARAQSACTNGSTVDGATRHDEDQLYRIAHDFKGHAGSYGYPLVSMIAASMCSLIKRGGLQIPNTHDAIDCHVNAIQQLIEGRMSGDGGESGQQIVENLRRLLTATT